MAIRVSAVNDDPESGEDMYTADEDGVLTVTTADGVLHNDSDIENDDLTAELVDSVSGGMGSLVFGSNGAFVFTPAANVNGTATFSYRAKDANGGVGAATAVTIVITAKEDPVVIGGLSPISVNEADSVSREIVATDPDLTDPSLTITGDVPAWVTSTVTANRIRLKVKPGYDAVQSGSQAIFRLYIRVESGQETRNDSLSITVINVNRKPSVVLSLTRTVDTVLAGTALSLTVTANDEDGTVSRVVLYHNNDPSTDDSPPYQFTIAGLAYGIHRFSAVAIDNNNDTARTSEYIVKAGRWSAKEEPDNFKFEFDNEGVPVRASLDSYSDRHVFNFGRYNMVSGTWGSFSALSIELSDLQEYWSDDNAMRYSFTLNNNNSPVVLLEPAKSNFDGDGNLVSYDQNFMVYQLSGSTWSRMGTVVSKPDLIPIQSFSSNNITVSSGGAIAFCVNETEFRSNVSSTSYILSGGTWNAIQNPLVYTDIAYLQTALYSHCGSFIYENPVKVHSLSSSSWSPVGTEDGTVVSTTFQHNILTRSDDGILHIAVPDKGVFTYSNGSWHKLWPSGDSEPGLGNLTVTVIDEIPYITYTTEDANLYCKRIRNGVAEGAFGGDGLIGPWSTEFSQLSRISEKKMFFYNDNTNWIMYRLEVPD